MADLSKYWIHMYHRDGYKCVYCGDSLIDDFKSWKYIEGDHLIPRSMLTADEARLDNLVNMVTTCRVCNTTKKNYFPEEFKGVAKEEIWGSQRERFIASIRNYLIPLVEDSRKEYESEKQLWASKTKINNSSSITNQKEASRKKSLGELGELFGIKALVDNSFDRIKNLNDESMNFPFADLYAEKNGESHIISIKARNKFQKNGMLNSSYNLGSNSYSKASKAEEKFNAKAYWMAVQFDNDTVSIYFGSLIELEGKESIPIKKCMDETIGECLLKDERHYFDFSYFSNQ